MTDEAAAAASVAEQEEKDPRFARAKARAGGDKGREMIEHLVQGAELDQEEEVSALDYLLGAPKPIPYDVTVQIDTPKGARPLTFVFTAVDGRKIDEIDERHRSQTTGMIDRLSADVELVAQATLLLEDASGKQIDPKSEEFRTFKTRRRDSDEVEPMVDANTHASLERRFRTQFGLLSWVAQEIRRVSGWDVDRRGQAQRRLVKASLD